MVHNYYQQPGGEDVVFTAECDLMRRHGHQVVTYTEDNRRILNSASLRTAVESVWSLRTRRQLLQLLRQERPDVAHFHNIFPLISPSAYSACREVGVPVVQTLHNPRLICPSGTLHRNGQLCEDCLGKTPPWPGVVHKCYKDSAAATAAVAAMLTVHRALRTWQRAVDMYIVTTQFYRKRFISAGLPDKRTVLKQHFVYPDPGSRWDSPSFQTERRDLGYALFIGRLHPEKGIRTLLRAWCHCRDIPLVIRADGRLMDETRDFIRRERLHQVELVGRLARPKLMDLIKGARFLVWPSEGYYETFGLVAIEAYACGVPVIAGRIGVAIENVEDGRTGLHFEPGDPHDLATKVRWAWTHPFEMDKMGRLARQVFERKYTADRNYEILHNAYLATIERVRWVADR